MYGRFALAYPRAKLIEWSHAALTPLSEPRYNIVPTADIVVIRDADNGRIRSTMLWELIPYWIKDQKKLLLFPNACSESLTVKSLYKNAFRRQYCLIPASSFYKRKHSSSKSNKPFYISAKDASPLPFAGLWETTTVDEMIITSCKILTTHSNELMHSIHACMPMILPLGAWNTWLSSSPLSADVLMLFLCNRSLQNRCSYGRCHLQ